MKLKWVVLKRLMLLPVLYSVSLLNYSKKLFTIIIGISFSLILLILLALLSNVALSEIKNKTVLIETVSMVPPPAIEEIEEELMEEVHPELEIEPIEIQKPLEMEFKKIPISLDINTNPSDMALKIRKFKLNRKDFDPQSFELKEQDLKENQKSC